MKLKNALENLKSIFDSYSPLWESWRVDKLNNLTEKEIYVVEVYRLKNFMAGIDDQLMFYTRPELIESITEKLYLGLKEFEQWKTKQLDLCKR